MAKKWVSIGRGPKIMGFWNPKPADILHGTVKKFIDGDNPWFVFKLSEACLVEDREEGELEAKIGEHVGVSGRTALMGLVDHIGSDVKIRYKGKSKAAKSGREFHDFDVAVFTQDDGDDSKVPF